MKRLLIMRHAKSNWDDPRLADVDRPLNDRGKRAAPFIGGLMRRLDLIPDRILSSPARRARKTAKLAAEAGAFDIEIEIDDRIYEASGNALRQVVSETGDAFSSIMLVGHNPGI